MAYATEVDTLRGNWIRFIYGTARISDSTRVLMLALSEGMRPDGHVEISRNEAANLISRSPRRVSGRYTDAIEAGVLKQIARGNRKNKSVFQALIPSGEEVTHGGHLFPGEQRTDSRPHSSKTTDTPGAHVHEETGDTRGAWKGPATGHTGVTGSERPIREGSPPPSTLPSTSVIESGYPQRGTVSPGRERNERITALSHVYFTAVKRMGKWEAIRGVVKKAVEAGYTDGQIERGLLDVADGPYGLTANTLRFAMERTRQRSVPYAAADGHRPYRNPTDQDVYDEGLLP